MGDLVYLKLQLYVQSSIAPRSNQKLSYRFFGPYKILARVGSMAYKLDLSEQSKIHPVVHVSQLKQHIPPTTQVSTDSSTVITDEAIPILPVAVLESKLVAQAGTVQPRVKI